MKFNIKTWNEENKKLFNELCCDQDAFIINGCNGMYDEINIDYYSIQFKNSETLINLVIDSDVQLDHNSNIITKYGITINETTRICVMNLDAVKSIIKSLNCR